MFTLIAGVVYIVALIVYAARPGSAEVDASGFVIAMLLDLALVCILLWFVPELVV